MARMSTSLMMAATAAMMAASAAPAMARDRYDGPRHGYDYGRHDNGRVAVRQCAAAVERGDRRYGRIDVTQVTSIDRKRDGYKIKGRVAAGNAYRDRWGRGGGYRTGKFTCDVRYGRVQNVKLSGLR